MVTGGAGFIGLHLVDQLLRRGERVRVLDIDAVPLDLGPDVETHAGSVLDPDRVRQAMEGVRRVYHLAGNPNLWAAHKAEFDRINVEGTRVVLGQAARAGVERIVVTSSETVLRNGNRDTDAAGLEPERTLGPEAMPGAYSRSKFLADRQAREAARHGVPAVMVYPTLPIGAGDRHLTPPTRMLLEFLKGTTPAYFDCELNLVAVEDVALGHILAAEKGRVGGRYVIDGENLWMHDILAILEEITGRSMPRHRIPYWLAFGIAAWSEFFADHISHQPPLAPLEGVRLASTQPVAGGDATDGQLDLPHTAAREALVHAVDWLKASGLAPA